MFVGQLLVIVFSHQFPVFACCVFKSLLLKLHFGPQPAWLQCTYEVDSTLCQNGCALISTY